MEYSKNGNSSYGLGENNQLEKYSRDIEIQFEPLNTDKSNGIDEDTPSVKLINFPRLEIFAKNSNESNFNHDNIIITPNSINGKIKISVKRFLFGSSEELRSSMHSKYSFKDYYFDDELMAYIQFEINYFESSKKFFVCGDKKGTGLFVKINKKIEIFKEVIISFCSCHMILQSQINRKKF